MKNNHLNDSPFFQAMGRVGDVFLLNVCWLGGCLPVVTIGASTTAAFAVANKMAAGQEVRIFHDYALAFKRDWALATRTWVLLAAAGALIWADYRIGLAHSGTLGGVLIAAAAALGVAWLCAAGGGFALLGRFTYTRVRDVCKDGLRIALGCPRAAALWAVGMAALPLLYAPAPQVFWYLLPLWLLIGGGGVIAGTAYLLRPTFSKLENRS